MSNFMHSLSQLLKIRITASTTYHPHIDGQMEWVNQEVEQFLQLFVNQHQDKWLSIAEFAYNDQVHASMQSSPFMLHQAAPSAQCRTIRSPTWRP